jgi:hypothetical protein
MVVFSLMSARSQKKSARAAQEANEIERKKMALEQAREKRETIRAARMARGQAVNTAAAQGVQDSSGALGGQASIGSQLNYNISFLDQQEALSDQASAALGRARLYESNSRMYSGLASLTWKAAGTFS